MMTPSTLNADCTAAEMLHRSSQPQMEYVVYLRGGTTQSYVSISVSSPATRIYDLISRQMVEMKFRELASKWRKETAGISNITDKSMNPYYQKIIGLGKDAEPFIIRELAKKPDHWLWALEAIVDESKNPITEEISRSFRRTVDAWIEYGRQRGYLKDSM